jgi:hypothetical protein
LGYIAPVTGAGDPAGARVWIGPELEAHILAGAPPALANVGNHYLDALGLASDGITPNFPAVGIGTVMASVNTVPSKPIYGPLITFLTNTSPGGMARPLGTGANGVFLFPYDWRRDIPTESARLSTFIAGVLGLTGAPRVNLITHSYGGPIARDHYRRIGNVDQVISMGGGFMGVILPIKILMMGDTWGFGASIGPFSIGLAEWELESLAKNWPTAYAQGPNSEDWFFDHGGTISPGGSVIDRTYIRDRRSILTGGHPVTTPTQAAHMAWLASEYNSGIVGTVNSFNAGISPSLGDFRAGTAGVYHHRIIGHGTMNTVVAGKLSSGSTAACPLCLLTPLCNPFVECPPLYTHRTPIYGDGDGTVPYHGLLGRWNPTDDRVYVMDKMLHFDMAQNTTVHSLIRALIDGTACGLTQARVISPSFESPANVVEMVGPAKVDDPVQFAALSPVPPLPPPPSAADRWLIDVRGGVDLEVQDQSGRRLGRSRDPERAAEYEIGIRGANFQPGESFTSVALPDHGIYRLTLTGLHPGVVQLRITGFSKQGRLGTLLYADVPMDPTTHAELVFDTGDEAARPLLTVRGGPAGPSAEYVPLTLSAAESTDEALPRTVLYVEQGRARAVAADEGSGVLKTYYTTNAERFDEYREPFEVPADAKIVMAFSMDRNGNLEYPGAAFPVLGVNTSQLTFETSRQRPGTGAQPIDVVNRDPIRVTGPLEWEARGHQEWITLDKPSGQTPDQLQVSVVPLDSMRPGEYRGEITIRSTTPNTVFPERTVIVELVVRE